MSWLACHIRSTLGRPTAYCEKVNGANISQSDATREISKNMMLECGWIATVENRQSKLKWESEVERRMEVSEKARPRQQLICGRMGKVKSQNQYALPHEHGSIERRECRPMRLVI
jgi:hypothetical protein